ncbi:MAG TPA: flagellar biosynthesis anti-sigma factor FlgM [Cellvibrionaceae bacterium]
MVIDPNSANFGKIPIKKGYSNAVTHERAQNTANQSSNNATLSKPATAADNVSLSAKAQSLARLESRVAQAPDVDRKKVDAIKQSIAEGRYKINPEQIAKAMLDAEQQAY